MRNTALWRVLGERRSKATASKSSKIRTSGVFTRNAAMK